MYYAPIELTRVFAQCLGWNEKCLVVMLSEGRAMFPQLFKRGNEKIFQRPKKTLENRKEDHCMQFHKMIGTFATNTTEKYT